MPLAAEADGNGIMEGEGGWCQRKGCGVFAGLCLQQQKAMTSLRVGVDDV